MKGKLFLVPVTLGTAEYQHVIPEGVLSTIKNLRVFIVEDIRSARRFLRSIDSEFPIDDCEFLILNEHTRSTEYSGMLKNIREGNDTGLMSEAGVPGIADPGSPVIRIAHTEKVNVVPLSGPSSILMAMMSSGLNGQNFAFNGYLPVKRDERIRKIKQLEALAIKGQSQILMETPYRNMHMLEDLLNSCDNKRMLCIASNISTDKELIITKQIKEWKSGPLPDIHKCPTIFIIG